MPKGKYIYYWYEYKWPPVRYDYDEALATQMLRHFFYYYYYHYYYLIRLKQQYQKPESTHLRAKVNVLKNNINMPWLFPFIKVE